MSFVYTHLDIIEMFIEGIILQTFLLQITERRWKWLLEMIMILAAGFLYSGIVFMTDSSVYSMMNVPLKTVLLILISFMNCKAPFGIRFFAANLIIFINITIENISRLILVLFMGDTSRLHYSLTLIQLVKHRNLEHFFICLGFYIIVLFLLRHILRKFKTLQNGYLYLFGALLISGNLILAFLIRILLRRTPPLSQVAVLFFWVFFTAGIIAVLAELMYVHKTHQRQNEYQLILSMNQVRSEGYKEIAEKNDELRRLAHDFKHHLRAMQNMDDVSLRKYIAELTKHPSMTGQASYSGDRYVDAIINSRQKKISALSIGFKFNMGTPTKVGISPADLCSIISNQLDNAIEACEKIENAQDRWIDYSIDQHGDMWIFRCENAIVTGSLQNNALLCTTKENKDHMHGYGLKSLEMAAKRNQGVLQTQVLDDRFISIVSVSENGS